ncbi:hypothetical protein AU381_00080 [Sinorhizobium glycinis]|uniref:DUF2190 domain-containing protein n=1 Tax=Sinorhizobium glycinis TaxID=1472378 RepID=A0A178XYP6_9HYPH|nr:hypothetical protein [Sinorhizobium glycinis]OAP40361.1 hypothetical protein AU381_00080 [Sinorhizobium glycinis]
MGLNRKLPARDAGYQNVQYLRKTIGVADMAKVVKLGTIPAGALILKPQSGVQVNTVFNSATTTVLDIGSAADGDLYATDLDVKTAAAFVPLDEAVSMVVTVDTELTCTLAETGTAATAGSAVVVIAFLPNN